MSRPRAVAPTSLRIRVMVRGDVKRLLWVGLRSSERTGLNGSLQQGSLGRLRRASALDLRFWSRTYCSTSGSGRLASFRMRGPPTRTRCLRSLESLLAGRDLSSSGVWWSPSSRFSPPSMCSDRSGASDSRSSFDTSLSRSLWTRRCRELLRRFGIASALASSSSATCSPRRAWSCLHLDSPKAPWLA
jgi:hypothetical protein